MSKPSQQSAQVSKLETAKVETKVSTVVSSLERFVAMFISIVVEMTSGKRFENGEAIETRKFQILLETLKRGKFQVERFGSDAEFQKLLPREGEMLKHGEVYREMRKVVVPLSDTQYVHYRNTLVSVFGKPSNVEKLSREAEVEQQKKRFAENAKREEEQQKQKQ